ncbi:TetR/AcrR family transcriptional regulator [Nesterenkonia sp. E16_7]|uniref:TetR/AcrR family transcriptional regulator n=1 Tax=unclassified Nesterenkonia TaxID=2629769 RepID=UPI001A91D3DE|nr:MULTISPECIES: TetR/AcrR family transcriptional regulator [unclassified Nesterenkonia]MBO0595334.1 TetR/AcrR family transcriptional regulator [Nesterenkonia sp. E16_10]MBO0599218.1 TetR/AcrR family transcriptional regulator [Nesterenkonia sp. E16_7]
MANPQMTRTRILDAAEGLFFQEGIATTGVDRTAAAAGVSIVTLYKHFGSKDNLLREILARRLQDWGAHWEAAIAAAGSPRERLLAIFHAVEAFRASAGQTQWCCFLATASERPAPAPGSEDPVFDLIRQDTDMVTERLTLLAEEAGCPSPVSGAASILLVYNGVLASLLRGEPQEPVAQGRATAGLIIDAWSASAAVAG